MLIRRVFLGSLTGGLLAAPLAGAQTGKMAQVGVLNTGFGPGGRMAHVFQALREGLAEFGYVESQNLTIEDRWADEREERLSTLAAELVERRVDVIVTGGPSAIKAVKSVTGTLPIVAVDFESDSVAAGFAASFARPGGNITGIFLDQAGLSGKWLALLKEAVPKLARVAVLWDAATPPHQLNAIKVAARTLALKEDTLEVRKPHDVEGAFAAAARMRAQGVVILSSPFVSRHGAELAAAAVGSAFRRFRVSRKRDRRLSIVLRANSCRWIPTPRVARW